MAADGQRVMFRFLDATGLPSLVHGHMHRVDFHFRGADAFSSRWSWFQNGEEHWMETIEYHRRGTAKGVAGVR